MVCNVPDRQLCIREHKRLMAWNDEMMTESQQTRNHHNRQNIQPPAPAMRHWWILNGLFKSRFTPLSVWKYDHKILPASMPLGNTGRQSKEMTLIVYPKTPRELHRSIHPANKQSAKWSLRNRIARIQVLFWTLRIALHKSASTCWSLKRKGEPLPRTCMGTILWVSIQ